MKLGGEKAEKYFKHFYRIWKVGESLQERLEFWRKNFLRDFSTEGTNPDQEEVDSHEFTHLYYKNVLDADCVEIPGTDWPTPKDIYIEKFYWEHGIADSPSARLRYFMSTFPETFKDNDISGFSESRKLSWCEWAHIESGHEHEINPNVHT